MLSQRLDPAVWPCETHYDDFGRITVGGVALTDIADQYGTPTYVLDEPAVKTGVADQKFGFPLGSAQAAEAIDRIIRQPKLDLVGFHCHLGSQIHDPDHYGEAVRRMIAEMARARRDHGAMLTELDLGGGHAVAYRPGDAEMDLPALADIVEDALDAACALHRFPRPRIALEPGRGIVAHAGITLYRVMTVKHVDGGHTFAIVDGGMNDNARVALYGAQYDAVVANRHPTGPHTSMTVAGRYCEAGDILVHDVRLPADLRPGEILAVPCTGAYHHSLASNYNGVGRPPIISVHEGHRSELVRRETSADLLARDLG
jgi:diaminopimelate decarboxylase